MVGSRGGGVSGRGKIKQTKEYVEEEKKSGEIYFGLISIGARVKRGEGVRGSGRLNL